MLENGGLPHHFEPTYLKGFQELSKVIDLDGALTKHLLGLSTPSYPILSAIANFVSESPASRKPLVESLIREESSDALSVTRLRSFEQLSEMFKNHPQYVAKLLDAEKGGTSLVVVNDFIQQWNQPDNPIGQALVEKMLDNGASARNLANDGLHAFKLMNDLFDCSPEMSKRILALSNFGYSDFKRLADFIEKDPQSRKVEVETMIMSGATSQQLDPARLEAIKTLENKLQPRIMQRLSELEKDGLSISDLSSYVKTREHLENVSKLIDGGATATQLASTRLSALQTLTNAFKAIRQSCKRLLN